MSSGTELLLLVAALLAVVILTVDLYRDWSRRRDEGNYLDLADASRAGNGNGETGNGRENGPTTPLGRLLAGAGLAIPTTSYLVLLLLAGGAMVFVLLTAFPRAPLAAILAGLITVYLLHSLVEQRAARRARRFEEHLVDSIDLMVAALEGGENNTQALASAAAAAQDPITAEFNEAVNRLSVGMPIRRALQRIVQRYDSEGVRLFTQVLIAKWQAGGDLAPVLRSLNQIIRERLGLRRVLASQQNGAQVAAVVVAVLPYGLIPFLLWRTPQWVARLWTHPLGIELLVLAIVLQIVGFLWLRRTLRMEL